MNICPPALNQHRANLILNVMVFGDVAIRVNRGHGFAPLSFLMSYLPFSFSPTVFPLSLLLSLFSPSPFPNHWQAGLL